MILSRRAFVATTLALSATGCQTLRALRDGDGLAPGTFALRGSETVAFTLSGNHIYLRAMLGKTPYAFLFDTAGAAAIVPEVQRALNFEVTGTAQVHGAGDAAQNAQIVRVPELSFGGLTYRNGSFLVLPLAFLPAEPLPGLRFGGLLGREFFETLVTTIDYEKSRLIFDEPAGFRADPSATVLPLALIDGHPNVRVAVGGDWGQFDIDAGSRAGVTISRLFANSSGLSKELGRTIDVIVAHGVGGIVTGSAARATSLTLGNLRLDRPPVLIADSSGGAFANANLAGNIGGEILRRFRLTLDVQNAKLYLRPNARIGEPFAFNHAGLFSERKDGIETVLLVVPTSPASEAGVAAGDAIGTLDGVEIAHLTGDQVAAAWQRPPGTAVRLELRRDGRAVRAGFVLRDII